MTVQPAKIWIECNPETGSVKPYEIFWQIGDGAVHKVGSCKTHENAEKSIRGTIKRNSKWYQIEVVGH
jgi:hypothetical protein